MFFTPTCTAGEATHYLWIKSLCSLLHLPVFQFWFESFHICVCFAMLQVVDFYEFYEGLQEGWDGPALLVFSDGKKIGARLDRNGLRPARFWRTADDTIYVASEVGVLGDVMSNAGAPFLPPLKKSPPSHQTEATPLLTGASCA